MINKLNEIHNSILPYIHRTPVLTSQKLNEITGSELYFKCENFQRMGAFKMRGAINAIMQLSDSEKINGVVTHSSGNFAQAIALAAKTLSITAYIVMPSNSPNSKIAAVKEYGGIVIDCPPTNEDREEYTKQIILQKGARFIHPSNDINVILGNATCGIEFLTDYKNLDLICAPIGGGGLIAGTILAAQNFSENTKIFGGEPANVDDAYRSLKNNKIEKNINLNTIADGLKTHLGDVNFPIIKNGIEKIIRIEEDEIIYAMRLIWERMKIIIEPSSAVAFAAILKEKNNLRNKKIGIIISGGNVDLDNLPF